MTRLAILPPADKKARRVCRGRSATHHASANHIFVSLADGALGRPARHTLPYLSITLPTQSTPMETVSHAKVEELKSRMDRPVRFGQTGTAGADAVRRPGRASSLSTGTARHRRFRRRQPGTTSTRSSSSVSIPPRPRANTIPRPTALSRSRINKDTVFFPCPMRPKQRTRRQRRARGQLAMLVLIDNYDSFTYNLVAAFGRAGPEHRPRALSQRQDRHRSSWRRCEPITSSSRRGLARCARPAFPTRCSAVRFHGADPGRVPGASVHRPRIRRRSGAQRIASCTARPRRSITTAGASFAGLSQPLRGDRAITAWSSAAKTFHHPDFRSHRLDRRRARSWASAIAPGRCTASSFTRKAFLTVEGPKLLKNFLEMPRNRCPRLRTV